MGTLHTTLNLFIVTVGTYGIATLIAEYDGPFNLFIKLRKWGKIFACSTCLSFWVAIILSLVAGFGFLQTTAVIGLAVALTRHL